MKASNPSVPIVAPKTPTNIEPNVIAKELILSSPNLRSIVIKTGINTINTKVLFKTDVSKTITKEIIKLTMISFPLKMFAKRLTNSL